jgi:hypothetical protein
VLVRRESNRQQAGLGNPDCILVDGVAGRCPKPALVGQFEFVESVEWVSDLHLRNARFIALREDERQKDEGIKPNCSS